MSFTTFSLAQFFNPKIFTICSLNLFENRLAALVTLLDNLGLEHQEGYLNTYSAYVQGVNLTNKSCLDSRLAQDNITRNRIALIVSEEFKHRDLNWLYVRDEKIDYEKSVCQNINFKFDILPKNKFDYCCLEKVLKIRNMTLDEYTLVSDIFLSFTNYLKDNPTIEYSEWIDEPLEFLKEYDKPHFKLLKGNL